MDVTPSDPAYVAAPLRLQPFRAHLVAPAHVADPATARLFAKPYAAVPQRLESWRRRRMLRVDRGEHLYLHEYAVGDRVVRGVVAALQLTPTTSDAAEAAVLPHEAVDRAQARQLADRICAMSLSPAPILLTAPFPAQASAIVSRTLGRRAAWDFLDHTREHHRIWRLPRADAEALCQALRPVRALVADGHHRLAAHQELATRAGCGLDAALILLVDETTTPLDVQPIHRVLERVRLDDIRSCVHRSRRLTLTGGQSTIEFHDVKETLSCGFDGDAEEAARILQEEILQELAPPAHNVRYERDWPTALASAGRRCVAVRLPELAGTTVRTMALTGRTLPEKATSYGPKPPPSLFLMRLPSAAVGL